MPGLVRRRSVDMSDCWSCCVQIESEGVRVTYLSNSRHGSRHLSLAIVDLGHRSNGVGSGWLSVCLLGNRGTGRGACRARDDIDVDGQAVWGDALVVQVGEVSRSARVEDGRASLGGQSAVFADGEPIGGDGIRLSWGGVVLKLVVGNDISDTSLAVRQNTILQARGQVVGLAASGGRLSRGEITLMLVSDDLIERYYGVDQPW